jgi:hypothetical protein
VLDRIALIATLTKAVLVGAVLGVLSLFPHRITTIAWLFVALALASCVILAAS